MTAMAVAAGTLLKVSLSSLVASVQLEELGLIAPTGVDVAYKESVVWTNPTSGRTGGHWGLCLGQGQERSRGVPSVCLSCAEHGFVRPRIEEK